MNQPLALVLVVLALASGARAQTAVSEADRALVRQVYQELVETNTTHSTGSTTAAAERVAARLRAAGIPESDIARLGPSPTKGNLVARLHGSGAEKPLVLLAHLDVVEAKREDWSVDPFVLLEQDGYFYGRGTLDDKAMAAIFTTLVLRLATDHTPLRRDVILALTADEEAGNENGAEWLLREHRELVDGSLVLNEGGGGWLRQGKYLVLAMQSSEKTYMDYALKVTDKGGHSSLPTPENAIYRLAAGLGRLQKLVFPVELNEVTREFLKRAAPTEPKEIGAAMRALAANAQDPQAAKRLSREPRYNALIRTTCVATQVEAGHARNALPQSALANVNCRILPGHSAEEVRKQLVSALADPKIDVALDEQEIAGPRASVDPELLKTVEGVAAQVFPGVPVVPTMSSGATDSKYFRLAGIPAYGLSGIFVDIDDVRAHGRDERVGVKQFYEGQEFLSRLVTALAASKP
ncbi:MAG TPA: M20/M25/M40 family metallo-hydrolase [Myxococcota bacterium]|nr:M20/M25/M40 family metallo-hydrolase [Myxococcota bacterium]